MISIVDDDAAIRDMLVSLVRSLGYDARSFASAEEFLASDDLEKFACMIADIHMPGMSGFELKELLVERNDPLPVIMITARTEPDLQEKAISRGAIGFLRKPFEVDTLVGFIEKALGSKAQIQGS
ncbi:response regulator transcription factor [Bradyrhizobium sp. Pha-3]|uniref:response regulator transcription factor n=1 Tax=Bradyrhizobium sp. Pha-3 TaxID=208375 RepID=UPI0035D4A419